MFTPPYTECLKPVTDSHGPAANRARGADPLTDCSLSDLCRSDTAARMGIDNRPDDASRINLLRLSALLREVSRLLDAPLTITSGYRCAELNAAVGGVPDSQHIDGLAADFRCPQAGTPAEVAWRIARSHLPFDQLILEYGRWVHLSIAADGTPPRREVLTILDTASGYQAGLPPPDETRYA